jgi:hypothetical protein
MLCQLHKLRMFSAYNVRRRSPVVTLTEVEGRLEAHEEEEEEHSSGGNYKIHREPNTRWTVSRLDRTRLFLDIGWSHHG